MFWCDNVSLSIFKITFPGAAGVWFTEFVELEISEKENNGCVVEKASFSAVSKPKKNLGKLSFNSENPAAHKCYANSMKVTKR